MRGALSKAEACQRRNINQPAHSFDVGRAGIRYATAGELRQAGFAVIHTCMRKGEGYGHVSIICRTRIRWMSRSETGLRRFRMQSDGIRVPSGKHQLLAVGAAWYAQQLSVQARSSHAAPARVDEPNAALLAAAQGILASNRT